ncbi:NAD(P)/FAD-dependent oxidoreductase [Latilactobacillus curvatus]
MLDSNHLFDITIIGGGPVGMFAAYYAGMRKADVQIIESLPELGGQVATLYPEKQIYDVAGFSGISGAQLTENLIEQLALFQPTLQLSTAVQGIEPQEDGTFVLKTTKGTTRTKGIIIAVGNGAFTPRKLAVDYDPEWENHYIHYFAKEMAQFKDQTVAVAGGGDSAIEWALMLEKVAKQVYLIHRRDQFRGLESSVEALKQSTVQIKTPFLIDSLTEMNQQLALTLNKMKSTDQEQLTIDKLLVNYGFISDTRILRDWGLTLDHHQVAVNQQLETNILNIYAIGDIATYPGKVKLIASGFGEAPMAVTELLTNLYPEKRQPLHSTSIM